MKLIAKTPNSNSNQVSCGLNIHFSAETLLTLLDSTETSTVTLSPYLWNYLSEMEKNSKNTASLGTYPTSTMCSSISDHLPCVLQLLCDLQPQMSTNETFKCFSRKLKWCSGHPGPGVIIRVQVASPVGVTLEAVPPHVQLGVGGHDQGVSLDSWTGKGNVLCQKVCLYVQLHSMLSAPPPCPRTWQSS